MNIDIVFLSHHMMLIYICFSIWFIIILVYDGGGNLDFDSWI